MARRSKMRGDIRLRRTLRNIHKTMDNELAPAMRQAAERVLATQQQLMPKDTGAGAAAWTRRSAFEASAIIGGISTCDSSSTAPRATSEASAPRTATGA